MSEQNQNSPVYEKNPLDVYSDSEKKPKKLKRKRSKENILFDSPIKKIHKNDDSEGIKDREDEEKDVDLSLNGEDVDDEANENEDHDNDKPEELEERNSGEEEQEDNNADDLNENGEKDKEIPENDEEFDNEDNDMNIDEGSEKASDDEEDKEKKYVNAFMEKVKKPSGKRAKDIDAGIIEQETNNIIDEMNRAYEEDIINLQQKKPALKKISAFTKIEKSLKNFKIQQDFINKDGLDIFQKWLKPQPDGTQPSLFLKKKILENLTSFSLNSDQCRKNDLGKLINKICLSTTEPQELKKLAKTIIDKWTRLLTDNHICYRSSLYRSESDEYNEKPRKSNALKRKTNEIDILNSQNKEVKYVVLPKKNNVEFFKNARSNISEKKTRRDCSEGTKEIYKILQNIRRNKNNL